MNNFFRLLLSNAFLAWAWLSTVGVFLTTAWALGRVFNQEWPGELYDWQLAATPFLLLLLAWPCVGFFILPSTTGLKKSKGERVKRLPSDHRVRRIVQKIAFAFDTPMPRVYLIENNHLNAFVIHGPRQPKLFIHAGLICNLDRDSLTWAIAHEMAHIKGNDARCGRLIFLYGQSVRVLDALRIIIESAANLLVNASRLFIFVLWPILIPAKISYSLLRLGYQIYLPCLRMLNRGNELRADSLAAEYAGSRPGKEVMKTIGGSSHVFSGRLDTHPTLWRRLWNLKSSRYS